MIKAKEYTRMNCRVMVYVPNHHRAHPGGYVSRATLVAEKALGKPLPKGVTVHHINLNAGDDQNGNLVICENNGYHHTLHRRQRAYEACGNANWRKCQYCKKHDDPKNLYISDRDRACFHKDCKNNHMVEYRMRKKGEICATQAALMNHTPENVAYP